MGKCLLEAALNTVKGDIHVFQGGVRVVHGVAVGVVAAFAVVVAYEVEVVVGRLAASNSRWVEGPFSGSSSTVRGSHCVLSAP